MHKRPWWQELLLSGIFCHDLISTRLGQANDLVDMLYAIDFHAGRAGRHPGNSDAHEVITLAEF